MRRYTATLRMALGVVATMMLGLAACPDPTPIPWPDLSFLDTDAASPPADGVTGDTDTVGPQPNSWTSGDESNDWRIVFNYRSRVSTPAVNELWIADPFGQDKQSITNLADLNVQEPPLSCDFGCFISEDLRWVAITTGQPTADGFSFRIGRFTNASLNFQLIKDLVIADKVDFKFAANRLFHTEQTSCVGASCSYDLEFRNLDFPGVTTSLQIFPPADQLEQSTYKGHFKVSPDGEKLILLNTTIRSVAVHLYKVGVGLVELDFLCKFGTKGNCQGTGSEYQDTDPVAISPDGKYAVFFTFGGSEQRANVYDLESPGVKFSTILASVPLGSYIEKSCDFGVLAPWQWQRVVGDPVFTPDGSEIVFLTETDCKAPNGSLPVKPRRDLVRIKLATLLAEVPITEADIFNVTANPVMGGELGATRNNLLVESFRVSPDGNTIVFSGTPFFDQNGDILEDSSTRTRNDQELFRVRLDRGPPLWPVPQKVYCDKNLCQISNDLQWKAQSPRLVPPAGAF